MGCFGSYYPSALWSEHNASPAPATWPFAATSTSPISRPEFSAERGCWNRSSGILGGWFCGLAGAAWALREIGCDAIKSLLYLDRNGLWGRVCTSGIPEKHLAGVWSGALA